MSILKRRAALEEASCKEGPLHATCSWLWKTASPAFSIHILGQIFRGKKSAQFSAYTQPVAIPLKDLVPCWVANWSLESIHALVLPLRVVTHRNAVLQDVVL